MDFEKVWKEVWSVTPGRVIEPHDPWSTEYEMFYGQFWVSDFILRLGQRLCDAVARNSIRFCVWVSILYMLVLARIMNRCPAKAEPIGGHPGG